MIFTYLILICIFAELNIMLLFICCFKWLQCNNWLLIFCTPRLWGRSPWKRLILAGDQLSFNRVNIFGPFLSKFILGQVGPKLTFCAWPLGLNNVCCGQLGPAIYIHERGASPNIPNLKWTKINIMKWAIMLFPSFKKLKKSSFNNDLW